MSYHARMRLGIPICAVASVLAVGSCSDPTKISEEQAVLHAERLAKLADDDVEEVRRGLPKGAKALTSVWEGKSRLDHFAVRQELDRVRGQERDLEIAKSTFFAITDDKGAVLASDQTPDQLAGRPLGEAFPALARVLHGEPVETRGSMPELAGARGGSDEQWVASAPVVDAAGTVRAMYATGWSLRRFAYHLEETLKHDLVEQAVHAGTKLKLPLVYVFVFAGGKVYGAPVTPLVNAEALEALNLQSRTENAAVFHQKIEITGRAFGVAARRCSKMGSDVGVAVLRSET